MSANPVIVLAGAPSGGHLYPGLALAKELRERGRCEVHFITSGRPLEAKILEGSGFEAHAMPTLSLRRPQSLVGVGRSVAALFRRLDPAAVVGLGGAPSLWPVFTAALQRRPAFLLEQNRVLGRANRRLLRFARRVFLSYDETSGSRGLRKRGLVLGCPVRRGFEPSPIPPGHPEVLVLGGSQGAQSINELVPAALDQLSERGASVLRVHHIAGEGKSEGLRERYRQLGVDARVVEYLDDPAPALRASALVIGRAGGSTLAEIAAAGRGSVLVPYPHHRDRQQFRNAEALVSAGAATVIDGEPSELAQSLQGLLGARSALERMADAAGSLGVPDAAERIATTILTHLDALPADHPVVVGSEVAA